MTVEAITRKAGSYVCRPGTVYPFGFKVFSASDVYVVLAENGIEARAAYGTDYVVRLNDNQDNAPGGEVVLLCEAAGKSVTIGSCVPYTQEVVITNKGGFYPAILNKAYDKLTILVQQLLEEVSRCVKVPISGKEKPDALIQTVYESALTARENAQLSVTKAEDAAASAESAAASADNAAGSAAASAESAQEAWAWANTAENELVQTDDHVGYSAWHHAQKAKENADAAASAIMPGALVGQLFYGQIVLSAVPLDSDGLCLLDGRQLQKGSCYDKFIAHIAGLKEDHPDLFVTETAWWATELEYGSCGKFVLGEDSIRLPKVSSILQCTTDTAAVGDLVKAGLPNITGTLWSGGGVTLNDRVSLSPFGIGGSGAITVDGNIARQYAHNTISSSGHDAYGFSFNASRSNPLYGASDTVQPQTLKVLAYIVVDAVDVDALNKLLKTVNEEGETGQTLTKGEDGAKWADAATLARTGNFKDGVFIGPEPFVDGPMILTPDDVGKHFYMSTSVPVGANINLPDSSLCHTGSVISFHSVTATPTFRINTVGTDTIGVIGGPLTTLLVPPNSYLAFINVMAGRWELLIQECAVPWKLWKKVSRAVNVTYTNESGRHKIVSANALSSSTAPAYINIVLPGGNIYFCDAFVGQKGIGVSAQAIIAPGEQYHFEIGGVATVTYLEKEL